MRVDQRVPLRGPRHLAAILEELGGARYSHRPFSDQAMAFCDGLSQALFRDPEAKSFPELQALAFWCRRAAVARMRDAYLSFGSSETRLVPCGLAFHIPPGNVDTIFIYSWLLSLLAGNTNLVRLPSREAQVVQLLCRALDRLLAGAEHASVRSQTAMIGYDHDAEITSMISQRCDLRIIWGGDATIATIRAVPLNPRARELVFSDRFSFSIIDAEAYEAAEDRQALAERFYNDAYWFGQTGCSSPRLVVWRGAEAAVAAASGKFFAALCAVIERKDYKVELGTAIAKLNDVYGAAIERPVARYQWMRNELSVITLESLAAFNRYHRGGGLFFQVAVADLDELVPFVRSKDQTVGCYGLSAQDIAGLIDRLNGRGIDRFVPIGEALSFHRFWDGYDLLRDMSKQVHWQTA